MATGITAMAWTRACTAGSTLCAGAAAAGRLLPLTLAGIDWARGALGRWPKQ